MKKNEKLIKKLAEETIYSAKGHFKSSDIRRTLVTSTIWICAILSVLGMVIDGKEINKWFSAFGLIGTIGLLIWNEGEEKNYRSEHKRTAEQYLSIHKEIRDLYFLNKSSTNELQTLSNKVKELDKQEKPDITYLARKWAQFAIKKNNETDNWYKKL